MNPRQPFSVRQYWRISGALLFLAVCFLLLYYYMLPTLFLYGLEKPAFYLVLCTFALGSSCVLVGVLRSRAQYTEKDSNRKLSLGGAVVVFGLIVVVGGRLWAPRAVEPIDLTVRVHSADLNEPLISSGEIEIELGNDRRLEPLNSHGEANFKGIPTKFRGAEIRVLTRVEGYKLEWHQEKLAANYIDYAIERAPKPSTYLVGSIVPVPLKWQSIRITVEGQGSECGIDPLGRFNLPLEGKDGDRIRLRIYSGRTVVFDDYETAPGPVTLKLHK